MDQQKAEYEQVYGRISTTGELLNLVLDDPHFAWLRQLSGMIVQIDEIVAARSKAGFQEAAATLEALGKLLVPSESGTPFQQNYWRAIQTHPDVLMMHGDVRKLLQSEASPLENGGR